MGECFDIVFVGRCISSSALLTPYYQGLKMSDSRLYSEGLLHGGNAAVQAMLAARLDHKVALVTRYCNDFLTQMCMNNLRFCGVSVDNSVSCKDRGISDDNALECRCGYKQLDDAYLTPDDIKQAEHIISTAKVVIVHYEIGFMATMETLKLCKNTVSILFASPLPDVMTKRLFEMPTFILFDGKRDLEMMFDNKMLRNSRQIRIYRPVLNISNHNIEDRSWIYNTDELLNADRLNPISNLVSILFASPLPNLKAESLFQMATFVLFDGKKDLEVQFRYKSWQPKISLCESVYYQKQFVRHSHYDEIANLMRHSLSIGAQNAIIICNSIYTVYGGYGYEIGNKTNKSHGSVASLKWLCHSCKNPVDTASGDNMVAHECVVSLAFNVLVSPLAEGHISLQQIVDDSSKLVTFYHESIVNDVGLSTMEIRKLISSFKNKYVVAPYTHFELGVQKT